MESGIILQKILRLENNICCLRTDFCSLINGCLGISSDGDPSSFLNRQGNWVAGGTGVNIYNADGSLTGNRVVDIANNNLLFTNLSQGIAAENSINNTFFGIPINYNKVGSTSGLIDANQAYTFIYSDGAMQSGLFAGTGNFMSSGSIISINGTTYSNDFNTVQFGNYPNSRDDSGTITPVNFLYTDVSGILQSAPVSYIGWGLQGNSGTDPSVNFLGTTDGVGFNIKSNNVQMLHFDEGSTNPNILIGAGISSQPSVHNIGIGNQTTFTTPSGSESATYQVALGFRANVAGLNGISAGYQSSASNDNSIAIGSNATTTGTRITNNIAIGKNAVSSYNNSVCIGTGATDNQDDQFAIGTTHSSFYAPGMATGSGFVLTEDGTGLFSSAAPVVNGVTASEPTSPYLGQFYFDTTLTKMKFWNGSVWAIITSTP